MERLYWSRRGRGINSEPDPLPGRVDWIADLASARKFPILLVYTPVDLLPLKAACKKNWRSCCIAQRSRFFSFAILRLSPQTSALRLKQPRYAVQGTSD